MFLVVRTGIFLGDLSNTGAFRLRLFEQIVRLWRKIAMMLSPCILVADPLSSLNSFLYERLVMPYLMSVYYFLRLILFIVSAASVERDIGHLSFGSPENIIGPPVSRNWYD
jgi:hypothetical protein